MAHSVESYMNLNESGGKYKICICMILLIEDHAHWSTDGFNGPEEWGTRKYWLPILPCAGLISHAILDATNKHTQTHATVEWLICSDTFISFAAPISWLTSMMMMITISAHSQSSFQQTNELRNERSESVRMAQTNQLYVRSIQHW